MMSVTACPHCSNSIPPEFAAMPICYICGGDLKAAPAEGAGWASIDVKANNIRVCSSCNFEVKSVLAMECPNCGSGLSQPGQKVDDIEKEKRAFEEAVQASQASPVSEGMVTEQVNEEIAATHPEEVPETIPVNPPVEAIADVMPEAEVHPVEIPMAEVIAEQTEELTAIEPVIQEEPDVMETAPPVAQVQEEVQHITPPARHQEIPVTPPVQEIKPPVIHRSEPVQTQPPAPEPEKKKEGFFAKLLRMFGLKKD